MEKSIISQVIVYHDETSCAGNKKLRGHVLLFIPVRTTIEDKGGLFACRQIEIRPWAFLFKNIENIRKIFQADHKFHFSDISGKKWAKFNQAERCFVQVGVEALKQKKTRDPLYCKLGVIFYENPRPWEIAGYGGDKKKEQVLRFGETILRMLLKGTVHYLYDNYHRVKILKIFTDGKPHHRKLNEDRTLDRLIDGVRNYAEIANDAEIIPLKSDHKKHDKNSEEYVHANMLQLADMLLGSTIHACLKDTKIQRKFPNINDYIEDKKGIIAYPVREMLDKRKRKKGFKNSSHYKAFTISKAIIKNGKWEFEDVMTKEILIDPVRNQINLFE